MVVVHLFLFVLAGVVIWLSAGRLIEVVDRLARRFRRSGFTVAFFVLGFLTSISEFSVMVNSTITGEPMVSAGNLAGASIGLLLFLVPFTAIMANGIRLDRRLGQTQRALALFAAAFPALVMADGDATPFEGVLCLLVYGSLLLLIRRKGLASVPDQVEDILEEVLEETIEGDGSEVHRPLRDAVLVVIGAVLIFVAGNRLVEETVYFSELLDVPSSVIGLIVLSIGTNIPEIVIAVRSVSQGHTGIAFGNYIGSAVANSLLFGCLLLLNGRFEVGQSEFAFTAAIIVVGFTAFFLFARSGNRISRTEGCFLVLLYAIFVIGQVINAARLGTG